MFTFKFIRQSGETQTSICGARYTVAINGSRTCVWIYPTHKEENPVLVELHLEEDQNVYYEMFVENLAGKTIDRHRAVSEPVGSL